MKRQPLVSIIIPTKNSEKYLENCLRSIKNQTYKNIEIIIVDSGSTDRTINISKKFNSKIVLYKPNVEVGKFDAPHKRNYGIVQSKGDIVYYLDADMEMPRNLVIDIIRKIYIESCDALVVSEDSFGIGIWAKAKQLERRCYWGDDTVEAARVFKRSVWIKLGGLDTSLGGGGDDWDLHHRLLSGGYKVRRTNVIIRHNEGELLLSNLFKKRFKYGQDSIKYLTKRPKQSFISYFPIRMAFVRNWKLFLKSPIISIFFIIMRIGEYLAGFSGIVYSRYKD